MTFEKRWQPAQRMAIDVYSPEILVAAAAGSGKTSVLVERLIRTIKGEGREPISVLRLLVLTFTNQAAGEMRERLERELRKTLEHTQDLDLKTMLQREIKLLPQAMITNFHRFALRMLRRYGHHLGLDSDFAVADETATLLIKDEVFDQVLLEWYERSETDHDFQMLMEWFDGSVNASLLKRAVFQIHRLLESVPDHTQTYADFLKPYDALDQPLFTQRWYRSLWDEVYESLTEAKTSLRYIRQQAEVYGLDDYLETLSTDEERVEWALTEMQAEQSRLQMLTPTAAASVLTYERLIEILERVVLNFPRLKALRIEDETLKKIKEAIQAERNDVKANLKQLLSMLQAYQPVLTEHIRIARPVVETLLTFTKDFIESYQTHKQRLRLLDFADLEHYFLALLRLDNGRYGEMIGRSFDEILIDEYQDTNRVQEAILRELARYGARRFMVGDVKQSIYRFRLSDPSIFLKKYQDLPRLEQPEIDGAPLEKGIRIDLTHNFRSRATVLAWVNAVFEHIWQAGVGELTYDEDVRLKPGLQYPPADWTIPELVLIERSERSEQDAGSTENVHMDAETLADSGIDAGHRDDDGQDPTISLEELTVAEAEARWVLKRIKALLAKRSSDGSLPHVTLNPQGSSMRQLSFKDIAILVRSTPGYVEALGKVFQEAGIPLVAPPQKTFFETVEVKTVLSLLNILDNRRQDIPLATVLRSPIVGLDDTTLAEIRLRYPDRPFYEAVLTASREDGDKHSLALKRFWEQFKRWQTWAQWMPIDVLLEHIYEETGYVEHVLLFPDGHEREARLLQLLTFARQYRSSHLGGLGRFLRYVEKIRETELSPAVPEHEKEDDAVQLLTIHGSKGLEFPVVFILGLGKMINQQDTKERLFIHSEEGIGMDTVDVKRRLRYPSLLKKAIGRRLHLERQAEEMRLLYVAMTRAREKLILVGTVQDSETWFNQLAMSYAIPSYVRNAKTMLTWVMSASGLTFLNDLRDETSDAWKETGLGRQRRLKYAASVDVDVYRASYRQLLASVVEAPHQTEDGSNHEREGLRPLGQQDAFKEADEVGTLKETLKEGLIFQPADLPYRRLPAKVSVSELKRRYALLVDQSEPLFRPPRRLREPRWLGEVPETMTPEQVGSATHRLLQALDFSLPPSLEALIQLRERLVQQAALSQKEADAVDLKMILDFWMSPLAQRLSGSRWLEREVPFTYALPAEHVFHLMHKDKGHALSVEAPMNVSKTNAVHALARQDVVLVQGMIDVLAELQDGTLLLLDYKTDRVNEKRMTQAIERYKEQLDLYAAAVETIYRRPVDERWLYFLRVGKDIPLHKIYS